MRFLIAVLVLFSSVASVAQDPRPVPRFADRELDQDRYLTAALVTHLGYAEGFQAKFETGYYQKRPDFQPKKRQAVAMFLGIRRNLSRLSRKQESFALIHYIDANKRLRAWLIDQHGVVAKGISYRRYQGLDYLQSALKIDSRTATRAPKPRGKNSRNQQTIDVQSFSPEDAKKALKKATGELLPGGVRTSLATKQGILLVLPVKDTGVAPYPALQLANDLVVDRWSVVVMPDIQTLASSTRRYELPDFLLNKLVLVGDPDLSNDPEFQWTALPGARQEVADVAGLLNATEDRIFVGKEASISKITSAINDERGTNLIYLASHGVANSINPMDGSFIALKDGHLYGQLLRQRSFQNLRKNRPLVVLSACQTALGKVFEGGGYGITRAWISAGAGQVVSSLWNVDDQATKLLMTKFVGQLKAGQTTEEAMRVAQKHVSGIYVDDPGAWASFLVFGPPSILKSN